jgi:hypothetical protein
VIAQDFFFDFPQGRPYRRNLRDNVNTIAIVLDHPRQTAHLSFDLAKPLPAGRLDRRSHDSLFSWFVLCSHDSGTRTGYGLQRPTIEDSATQRKHRIP